MYICQILEDQGFGPEVSFEKRKKEKKKKI